MARKLTTAALIAPKDGATFLLTETYLSNLNDDGMPPAGEPAELHLFIERRINGKFDRRLIHTLTAENEEAAIAQLREFASRPDVQLVEEKSRKVIPKEWFDHEQAEVSG